VIKDLYFSKVRFVVRVVSILNCHIHWLKPTRFQKSEDCHFSSNVCWGFWVWAAAVTVLIPSRSGRPSPIFSGKRPPQLFPVYKSWILFHTAWAHIPISFTHSASLSRDRPIGSFKASSPQSAVWCLLFHLPVSTLFLEGHPVAAYILSIVFPSLLFFLLSLTFRHRASYI
jgi:hypothetical protein